MSPQHLAQWEIEATDPNHPNHYHANLDAPAANYTHISSLIQKLRTAPESFGREDVVALFGALNAGQRMKNKVADENPLPELRSALLALVDGAGEPTEKIAAAAGGIKFARHNMLGELYGWANAEISAALQWLCPRRPELPGLPIRPRRLQRVRGRARTVQAGLHAQVGRLRPELPLNLEIDKLLNC